MLTIAQTLRLARLSRCKLGLKRSTMEISQRYLVILNPIDCSSELKVRKLFFLSVDKKLHQLFSTDIIVLSNK